VRVSTVVEKAGCKVPNRKTGLGSGQTVRPEKGWDAARASRIAGKQPAGIGFGGRTLSGMLVCPTLKLSIMVMPEQ
jgi:hypothetical protein